MIRTTTWHPSTCGCILEYSWDDQHAEDVRKHTFVNVRHCGAPHPAAEVGQQVEGSAFHAHHQTAPRPASVPQEPEFTPAERMSVRKWLRSLL